jgi:hypothetical protein
VRRYHIKPIECRDLLLVGMATSTNLRLASVSQKAMTLLLARLSIEVLENIRDVDVGSLPDGLVVDSGVGDDDHSGFLEGLGDVIGEVTGGESTGNGLSTGETSHLEDSSVTVRSSRDDGNVCGVLDGGEDSGSKDELLPGLTDVEDVDTWMLV